MDNTSAAALPLESVLGEGGLVARALGGRARPQQLDMARAVEAALLQDRTLIVEAGTGTGKTFAYLVPAILSGLRVIISTATRALQDQLHEKDLPFLRDLLVPYDVPVEFAVMKGLANYVCLRRLDRALVANEDRPVVRDRLVQIKKQAVQEKELAGDAASLGLGEDDPIWSEVNSGTDTRVGAGCSYHDRCFVTRMKQKAQEAKVVVVNHHLFFADLMLRTGDRQRWAAAIPDHDAVVFDEAHQIESVASDFFGENRNSIRFGKLSSDLERFLASHADCSERAQRLIPQACEAGHALFEALRTFAHGQGRFPIGPDRCTPELASAFRQAEDAMTLAAGELDLESATKQDAVLLARRLGDYGAGLGRIAAVITGDAASDGGSLAHLSRDGDHVALGVLPVDVAPMLRDKLFGRLAAVVLTSATLSTGSAEKPSFFYARKRLGLPADASELLLTTPFDVRSQSLLYTAADLPEPSDPDFDEYASARILQLLRLTRGGAFVLTTSRRMMLSLAASLDEHFPLLVQGRRPKAQMLEEFRRGGHGVLIGTKSFWEGVDVPGMALRLVIIDRLPFPVPTDPLWAARKERVESEGGNAFAELHLPHALLTLKQGFGRLLRREDDVGIVAVLDKRLVTRGYGKKLLAGLPPASRTSAMAEVEVFARARIWPRLEAEAAHGPPGKILVSPPE